MPFLQLAMPHTGKGRAEAVISTLRDPYLWPTICSLLKYFPKLWCLAFSAADSGLAR